MARFTQPFGKPEEVKKAEEADRPASAKPEPKEERETSTPKGVNKEVWDQAEQAVLNQSGLSGVGPEGRKAQIQERYDQMMANDKATKEWAGDSNLLGDIK